MKKKLIVVALPTDKSGWNKGSLIKNVGRTVPYDERNPSTGIIWKTAITNETTDDKYANIWKAHHLYLISSDEEIKEKGIWVIHKNGLRPCKVINLLSDGFELEPLSGDTIFGIYDTTIKEWSKIIATTNPELWNIHPKDDGTGWPKDWNTSKVPKIPQSLIDFFVEKQGKVEGVMVEYDYLKHPQDPDYTEENCYGPALTSSGEIIWYPIEEKMYTRAELMRACLDFRRGTMNTKTMKEDKEWFNKNYPQ